ncbi:MAG: hypothetical protein LBL90_00420 [Prevotellaceae bacterium]|jgi:hypothetical protein|nr:hypothetical protein [Prevotellaceae bacterium]
MKRFITIVLLLPCIVDLLAQPAQNIYVKVFENDCVLCYGGMRDVEKTSRTIPVQLVFQSMDERKFDFFIKNKLNLSIDIPYLISDSLYNELGQTLASEVILFENGKESGRWLLKDFKSIESSSPVVKTEFADSIIFERPCIALSGKYIIISDSFYGHLVVVDKDNFNPVLYVSNNDIDPVDVIGKIDSAMLADYSDNFKQSLKSVGIDKVSFPYFSAINGSKNIIISSVYAPPLKKDNDTLRIRHIPFLQEFDGKDKKFKLITIDIGGMEDDSASVWGMAFYSDDNHVIMDIHFEKNPMVPFLARFKYAGNRIIFDKYYPFALNADYVKQMTGLSINYIIAYPYALTMLNNELWNLDTGETLHLPLLQNKISYDSKVGKVERDYMIVDAIVKGDAVRLLLHRSDCNCYSVMDVNLENMQIERSWPSPIPRGIQSGIKFLDVGTLLYVMDNKVFSLAIPV